ncbi:MAG: cell wall hydrolase [Rhizobiales bacterium]|nr:cell wall hydrolase [Hyphomicrobiales bacterium]NRB13241.1 cell wall hydrolase [Hyphomicrobiales bacterium]
MKKSLTALTFLAACAITQPVFAHDLGPKDSRNIREFKCFVDNVYFEARNQTETGKFAVAFVTLNRVNSEDFPNSICEVVWQPGQFSWTSDGKSDIPTEKVTYSDIRDLMAYMYLRPEVFKDPTNGATEFDYKTIQD